MVGGLSNLSLYSSVCVNTSNTPQLLFFAEIHSLALVSTIHSNGGLVSRGAEKDMFALLHTFLAKRQRYSIHSIGVVTNGKRYYFSPKVLYT